MTRTVKIVGISVLLIVGQFVYGQKNEEKLVRQAFENYKTSILNNKGEEAVKFVDSRTIKYYNDILELVKTADSAKIETLSILDKFMIFTIRHRVHKDDILDFDGKSLLVYGIKNGMTGKESATISIGKVTINEYFAKGQLIASKQKSPFYFHFYKEDEQWKVDLTSIFPLSTMAFEQLIDKDEDVNELIFYILEIGTGKKPDAAIWKPIMQ